MAQLRKPAGLVDGGSLLRPTQWLQDMNILRRATPITDAGARISKRALYEIADPYITFGHRFVAPLIGSGSAETTDGALLWRKVIQPRLDDYMGEVIGVPPAGQAHSLQKLSS
jgi:hypothetical protein